MAPRINKKAYRRKVRRDMQTLNNVVLIVIAGMSGMTLLGTYGIYMFVVTVLEALRRG